MIEAARHLLIAPVLLPLVVGAAILLISDRHHRVRAALSVLSALVLLVVAVLLLYLAATQPESSILQRAYRVGDWPAPFAIVLVADRLAAIMLVLTGVLGVTALLYSLARWHRAGTHFHALVQFLLMGLNGTFLTGDLFNLFVFFEVMLAASYGLLLHGAGATRIRAGLQFIVINLSASLLFLLGVSLIYGIAGTLNMAQLALRIPELAGDERGLLQAGAAILGVAFVVKAAIWPLCFWLPTSYGAASPPAAALFTITSKVGIYALLRLWLLLFGAEAGAAAGFGGDWLLIGGVVTVLFGAIGSLASQHMAQLAGYSVLVSSGTVLAAIGTGQVEVIGAGLFYMVSSVLGISAFFLLIELAERGRIAGADVLAVTTEAFGDLSDVEPEEDPAGIVIPAVLALLGICFALCALLIAGLPPISGFIGKFALLSAAFNPEGMGNGGVGDGVPLTAWALLATLLLSGLAAMISMARAGIRTFWSPLDRTEPRVRLIEILPIGMLLLLCVALTVRAGPVLNFTQLTAEALFTPRVYVERVLATTSDDARAGGEEVSP